MVCSAKVTNQSEVSNMEYPNLFTPGRIGPGDGQKPAGHDRHVCRLAHHDGAVSDALAAYYEERAAGGVGLMITECHPRERDGRRGLPQHAVHVPRPVYRAAPQSGGTGARPWSQAVYAAPTTPDGKMWCSFRPSGGLTNGWRGSSRPIGIGISRWLAGSTPP